MDDLSLRGERVILRRLRADDRPRLSAILAEPAIAAWWGTLPPEQAAAELYEPGQTAFVIEFDGALVGSVQYSEEETPDYRHATMDIFVASAHQGRGLGSDALRALARYLFESGGHHRLTIDPALANERAIRTYRRLGFRPVGVMRQYERGRDGSWHDGLLMEMLAGELR